MASAMITNPNDYAERVYAGVLGKIIGIYVGLPAEGWPYERIMAEVGEIDYYIHQNPRLSRSQNVVNTSDDITGMFTFLRALPDNDNDPHITAAQIGQTWLNYFILGRTASWWGGMGISSEHTAMVRLLSGIEAPRSGSIAVNGTVVPQQIGARIFVDSWAMVAPGDPERAADFARRAGSVSHDGEGIYGAQIVAAMEAQAFVEPDLNALLDVGLSLIPKHSLVYRATSDIREWHAREPDWRKTRQRIAVQYGHDNYGITCRILPDHALVVLGLLYGDDDFRKSLMITATSGWDSDCNCSAVGCLLGIKNGLAGLDTGPDWRGPVEDRLYLSTADGGRAITDAVTETYYIVNIGRALAGQEPIAPKGGARFHFELPGSVQCVRPEDSPECRGTVGLENVAGHSRRGRRSLAIRYHHLAPGRFARAATATFTPPEAVPAMKGPNFAPNHRRGWVYNLMACPTLYPGQAVRAGLEADAQNGTPVTCRLYVRAYGANDDLTRTYGPEVLLEPGASHEFGWRIGDTGGAPIAEIGVEIGAGRRADGSVYLDYITWDGAPDVVLTCPPERGTMWRHAWIDAGDWEDYGYGGSYDPFEADFYLLVKNLGVGMLIQGTREWTDYRVSAAVTTPMARSAGIAARVQGLRRYYALLLCDDRKIRLVKALNTDTVLAESAFDWELGKPYVLDLQVVGNRLVGSVDGQRVIEVADSDHPLTGGAVALVVEEGNLRTDAVTVRPAR